MSGKENTPKNYTHKDQTVKSNSSSDNRLNVEIMSDGISTSRAKVLSSPSYEMNGTERAQIGEEMNP
jgi:hypothetical protein